ncbi:MAG: class I adenylate-forming enzyme family protein [Promethearchaeota archaeon]
MTLGDLVEKQAQQYPEKIFLYWQDDTVTYAQLNELTNKVANMFHSLGIRKGDVVSVLLPNIPEYVYLYLGIPKLGAIAGPVNALFKAREIQFVVGHSEAKVLVTIPRFMEIVNAIRKDLPSLEHVLVIGEPTDGAHNYHDLMKKAATTAPPYVTINEKEDPAAILYTSGTTGFPKGVLQTHFNIKRNAEMIIEHLDVDPSEDHRFMLILPLFHVNAQIVTIMSPLTLGASTILTPGFSAKSHWETVAKYRATTFSAVPTILSILLRMPHEGLDLSSIKWVICGAAPLPVEVMKAFESTFNCNVVEGYGLTEGTCASSCNPLPTESEDKRKVGSIGVALPDTKMKIVDDSDNEVSARETGEIICKGDNVMKGYFRNPEANAETLKEGWLYTGDLGYVDEDGFFYIVGRKKDLIIRGGENVYPREVEEVLYTYPGVVEAAVIGVYDEIYGEVPKAFIVMKEGYTKSEDQILQHCQENLADFKVPHYVEFRSELPKNPTGKIMKTPLREEEAMKIKKLESAD